MDILSSVVGGASNITPYIYAAVFAVGLALGGTGGYVWEHVEVLKLTHAIDTQKIEAAAILAKETEKVVVAEAIQTKLNIDLDKTHEAYIETTAALADKQSVLINSMQYMSRGTSGIATKGKGNSSAVDSKDDEKFTWVSRSLLKFLATESRRADIDGNDKNTLMDFVLKDNCGVPK